jgi:MYXO-CTERM domain-containing protein
MYAGYMGPRPRVQLWHGTSDTTINFNNQTEAIKEWTNVLGLPMTPTSTDSTSTPRFKIEKWQNSCGFTVLEAHTESNGGHSTAIDANAVISFFALDKPGPDPQAACGSSGGGGSGGMGGAMAGSGGALAGSTGVAMAGSSASAGKSGAMAAGGGGRADPGMPGSAGAIPLAGMIGSTAGASGNLGTGIFPNTAASEPTTSSASSGCNCAVESAQGLSSELSALLLIALVAFFRRRALSRPSSISSWLRICAIALVWALGCSGSSRQLLGDSRQQPSLLRAPDARLAHRGRDYTDDLTHVLDDTAEQQELVRDATGLHGHLGFFELGRSGRSDDGQRLGAFLLPDDEFTRQTAEHVRGWW